MTDDGEPEATFDEDWLPELDEETRWLDELYATPADDRDDEQELPDLMKGPTLADK